MVMHYDVWQTCMLLPINLTRSECASWVQAWGSIAAVLAAFGVVGWQIIEARALRRTLARISATGIMSFVDRASNLIAEIGKELEVPVASIPLGRIERSFAALAWPNDDDLRFLAGAQAACATRLVRVRDLCDRGRATLGQRLTGESVESVRGVFRRALEEVRQAKVELEAFVSG